MWSSTPAQRAALRRHRRWRPAGRGSEWQELAAGVAVLLALGWLARSGVQLVHLGPHHHQQHANATVAVAPRGPLATRPQWARAFLAAIPEPVTTCNLSAVIEWETREGGGFGNQAQNNPLNVNPGPGTPWPGYPATGAWAFPAARTGLAYTVQTIRNGNYPGILAALAAGNSAQAVCDAIMASPWASSHYGGTLYARC